MTMSGSQKLKASNLEKNFTYAPELNKKSVLIDQSRQNQLFDEENPDNCEPINRYELLFEYHKYLQEKREKKKEAAIEEELRECTFKPELISQQMDGGAHTRYIDEYGNTTDFKPTFSGIKQNSSYLDPEPGVSLYERAMLRKQQKEHEYQQIPSSQIRKEEKELSECTFRPD